MKRNPGCRELNEILKDSGDKKRRKVRTDLEDGIGSETNENLASTSSHLSDARKRTLEHLYIAEINNDHHGFLFENATSANICRICFRIDGELVKCDGLCSNYFHVECFIKKNGEISKRICEICVSGDFRQCFVCKTGNFGDSEILTCTDCKMSYHSKCLKGFPETFRDSTNSSNAFVCPQHCCHSCQSRKHVEVKVKQLVRCLLCPVSYHQDYLCMPVGSKILTQKSIICPRHPVAVNEKSRRSVAITWCFYCSKKEGPLIKCSKCPVAYHRECQDNEEELCEECRTGSLPLQNDIVWGKYLSFAWWPCMILPDIVTPEVVLKQRKLPGSFAVRFFGQADYGHLTNDRICKFKTEHLQNPNAAKGSPIYQKSLEEAADTLKILEEKSSVSRRSPNNFAMELRGLSKTDISYEPDESFKCKCRENDPRPCADKECLNYALSYECASSCKSGERCHNQRFEKQEYCKLKKFKTEFKGKGILAQENIEKGKFVIEYTGDFIDEVEMNRRMQKKLDNKDKHFYLLYVEKDRYVDAEFTGNLSKYINHSCQPNCETQIWMVNGESRMGIFASQEIEKGQEITFHYGFENMGQTNKKCYCGSENCSGFLTKKPKVFETKIEQNDAGASKISRKAIKSITNGSSKKRQNKDKKLKNPMMKESNIKSRLIGNEIMHKFALEPEIIPQGTENQQESNESREVSKQKNSEVVVPKDFVELPESANQQEVTKTQEAAKSRDKLKQKVHKAPTVFEPKVFFGFQNVENQQEFKKPREFMKLQENLMDLNNNLESMDETEDFEEKLTSYSIKNSNSLEDLKF